MNPFDTQHEAGTPSASQQALRVLKPTVLAVAMGCVGSAWAVEGGVVANGSGKVATSGATTTVTQSTDKMVVNWKNFDIAQGQTVRFAQPTASSAVLNRVTGPVKASDIQGTLAANGRVYVVNPAGVMFGATAVVNADSIVASTMNIDDRQFMAGGRVVGNQKVLDLGSNAANGAVENQGTINARQVGLLGSTVRNKGTINATGNVTLGAADTATLTLDNAGFSVALGKAELNAMVENGGLIVAKGGNVLLNAAAAGDAIGSAVRNTGTIEARRATMGAGGSIELRSNADGQINVGGRLTADDRIQVNALGTLSSNGRYIAQWLTLSGDTTVINAPVVNARQVYVHANKGITQNADITGERVSLTGRTIEQAANVTTTGNEIELATHQDAGTVKASMLNGGLVRITGKDITLNGDVSGTYGIDVRTGFGGKGTITAHKSLTSQMGEINLDAMGYGPDDATASGKVATLGAVDGNRVNLRADAVEVHGPVTGKGDVILAGSASLLQAGSVTSTGGNVIEQGGIIRHAVGATTTAAQRAEFHAYQGNAPTAFNLGDIHAAQVLVDNAAGPVNLDGAVSADDVVRVDVRDGSITAAKGVTSKYGMVGLSATDVTAHGTIDAAQGVYIGANGGSIVLAGPVDTAGRVELSAGKDITLNADVSGRSGIDMRANRAGMGGTITALESLTSETGDVYLDAAGYGQYGPIAAPGKVVTRGVVDGNQVNLVADGIEIDGPVNARGNVQLSAGKTITQKGDIAAQGHVAMNAASTIDQAATSKTTAGNAYLQASTLRSGVITASNDITLQGSDVTLGGKLTARNVSVPADAKNTAGNIVVTEPQSLPFVMSPNPYWQAQVQTQSDSPYMVASDSGERPYPVTESPDPGERPYPVTESPDPGERPYPVTESPDPGERLYVQSNLMFAAEERPYPVTESPDPGERPYPITESPYPGERPYPVTESPDPGERLYVQSNLMFAAEERPYPVTESPDPGERPYPVTESPDPGERPYPVTDSPDPGARP